MIKRTQLALSVLAAVACLCAVITGVALGGSVSTANTTIFGPNVYVFDPSMSAADIQKTATDIFSKMEANQFGSERYALLFKPGKYHVTFNVGFYTHVAGLGKNPDDVHINGGVNVNAEWMPNANATCNFWRTLENFAVTPSSTKNITRIAVSQAAALRRLHVKGELHLFAFDAKWNAGWDSGGFLADSVVDGKVVPASQQQWLSRNSTWSQWGNAVWNMVFVGCENTPEGVFPKPAYTVVDRTPVIREKPCLYMDESGKYFIFVPALQTNTRGVSWAAGPTPGTAIPIDQLYIAQPSTAGAASINAALAAGKHILFTPGGYSLDDTVRVTKADTIILGRDEHCHECRYMAILPIVASIRRTMGPWSRWERCGFMGVRQHWSVGSQRLCSSGLASASTCNRPAARASAQRVPRARRCPGPSTAS